ncbi:hypothetical protein KM043_014058 [Ampulex compressa]|nr:hypothetical protein KM043_014058 [Ampulex compressa]
MKPQKKAVVARKATKMPIIAKKRRSFLEKAIPDARKEKKCKKQEKLEDLKKRIDNDRRKSDKVEERKKPDDKRKTEERKKEKLEKNDDKKKCVKDSEKKWDKIDEKKVDKTDERVIGDEVLHDMVEKKKIHKTEDKLKSDKILLDGKKKIEKMEDKKKNVKLDEENIETQIKSQDNAADKNSLEEKGDVLEMATKKRNKDEKKKDVKLVKADIKDGAKVIMPKDKKSERKKLFEKDCVSSKVTVAKIKKDSKTKSTQKKTISRKTVLAKKSHLSVVKKLVDKKMKLLKLVKDEDTTVSDEEDAVKKARKKNSSVAKSKPPQERKPKLGKPMKAKLPQKNNRISAVLKKEDKLKTLAEKVLTKKKVEPKEIEKPLAEYKKVTGQEEVLQESITGIKDEFEEDKQVEKTKEEMPQSKSPDIKKLVKNGSKIGKKIAKKNTKISKVQTEGNNQTSSLVKDNPLEEPGKQPKIQEDALKDVCSKQEQISSDSDLQLDLKVEAVNGESTGNCSPSDSGDEFEEEYRKNKLKEMKKKERSNSPTEERARRMRLFGFWSGPKRHRVASLNALAKVHCLYENETGGVYLGGFCKPKPEKEKQKKAKEEKEEQPRKEKEKKAENKTEENIPKRKLRNVPGLRGKHWDMLESSSSSSSSDEDCEREKTADHNKKKVTKRRKRNEEVMDLKDMVVCKRMASLNATAILAASYSDEKNRCGSSSDSSSESEVEIIKRRKQGDSDAEKRKLRQNSDPDDVIKPSKKVVIVNQDTDVTITGVYVNQTRSTHHEGFCSIAGMQYRISSTSHTQTAATAVATELHDQQKPEQPCKSYTPLGALSSMQPPGSQGNHPNMSPRRHSAFSAPHQHAVVVLVSAGSVSRLPVNTRNILYRDRKGTNRTERNAGRRVKVVLEPRVALWIPSSDVCGT